MVIWRFIGVTEEISVNCLWPAKNETADAGGLFWVPVRLGGLIKLSGHMACLFICLTLIYTGWGAQRPTLHFSGYISQTVKASLTKLSEFFHMAITLLISLLRAILHVYVSRRRLQETGASRRKCQKIRFLGQNTP